MLRNKLIALFIGLFLPLFAVAETYVVSVGVGNYADPEITNLTKTETDAKSMSAFYKKGTKNVITITGEYATKAQILKSLRSQFGRAKKGDKIVFFFSGHGYSGGFCPYDMHSPETGLSFSEVIKIMQDSKASDKFIFADACRSGAMRKSNKKSTQPEPGNVLLFLSSRDSESSLESVYAGNGFFTKNLLRGLGGAADADGDRAITAHELFEYVSKGVKKDTKDRQHPVMWGSFPDNLVIVKYNKK